jgi:hypothetical protein
MSDVKWTDVQQALYDAIADAAKDQRSPLALLHLAEALAWTSTPNQPHGSSAAPSKA